MGNCTISWAFSTMHYPYESWYYDSTIHCSDKNIYRVNTSDQWALRSTLGIKGIPEISLEYFGNFTSINTGHWLPFWPVVLLSGLAVLLAPTISVEIN